MVISPLSLSPTRGLHQGGPASNVLFLAVAELLAASLRSDRDIHGISVREILHLLNQFADDLDVSMEYDQNTLTAVLNRFKEFQHSTGFQLSYDKTALYRIGSLRKSAARLYTEENMRWTNEGINVLGIEVRHESDETVTVNYATAIQRMEQTLNRWYNRSLSLYGKINVINTLCASVFVYKMSCLPMLPPRYVKQINTMMEKYIWNGHRPKISLQTLQAETIDGGAQLVDFHRRDVALKAVWVKYVVQEIYTSEFVYNILHKDIRGWLWSCNLADRDSEVVGCQNTFWNDVLKSWCMYHYDANPDEQQIIWYNSCIRIHHKPIYWKGPAQKGLMFVSQLYEEGQFKTDEVLNAEFQLSVMQINALKSSIPDHMKTFAKENSLEITPFTDKKFASFMAAEKTAKHVYTAISPRPEVVKRKEERWKASGVEVDIPKEVQQIKKLTTVMKYRSFQYRMLMQAIVSNVDLCRWGIKSSDMCSMCGSAKETCQHIFYDCEQVVQIWTEVRKLCMEIQQKAIMDISYQNVVLNRIVEPPADVCNYICLIAKQYIYSTKCLGNRVSRIKFRAMVYQAKSIEKYYAVKDSTMAKFARKWKEQDCGHLEAVDIAISSNN